MDRRIGQKDGETNGCKKNNPHEWTYLKIGRQTSFRNKDEGDDQ